MILKTIYKNYGIISATEIGLIDFAQTGVTSASTVRYNVDNTKFVIKWNDTPTFILDGSVTPLQILTEDDCISLMDSAEWTGPVE